jgi:hypothetical protein
MARRSQWIPAAGLLATMGIAVYLVVQLTAQAPAATGDFSNAAVAEVRDTQGQVILRGRFAQSPPEDDDDETERKATLEPTGVDSDAAGEAEVEFTNDTSAPQEIEFSVRNVQPGSTFTFVIDGQDVAAANADKRGRAEVELEVKRTAANGSR